MITDICSRCNESRTTHTWTCSECGADFTAEPTIEWTPEALVALACKECGSTSVAGRCADRAGYFFPKGAPACTFYFEHLLSPNVRTILFPLWSAINGENKPMELVRFFRGTHIEVMDPREGDEALTQVKVLVPQRYPEGPVRDHAVEIGGNLALFYRPAGLVRDVAFAEALSPEDVSVVVTNMSDVLVSFAMKIEGTCVLR
jgi:hypothetical protein